MLSCFSELDIHSFGANKSIPLRNELYYGIVEKKRIRQFSAGSVFQFQSINQSINQLYLNTVNGSASWFSDMPCKNYKV